MGNKTVRVAPVLAQINRALASDGRTHDERKALCIMIETILHSSGNYEGFHYLFDWNSMPWDIKRDRQYERHYTVTPSLYEEYMGLVGF